jgi:hypothetical protein
MPFPDSVAAAGRYETAQCAPCGSVPEPDGGAKVGANVHSHQAMPGDVQPPLRQVNGTLGDKGLRQATGRS